MREGCYILSPLKNNTVLSVLISSSSFIVSGGIFHASLFSSWIAIDLLCFLLKSISLRTCSFPATGSGLVQFCSVIHVKSYISILNSNHRSLAF